MSRQGMYCMLQSSWKTQVKTKETIIYDFIQSFDPLFCNICATPTPII